MFVAVDSQSDKLVSGKDVLNSETSISEQDQFHCLLCEDTVEFVRGENRYHLFTHPEKDDCTYDPRNSVVHQTGCEIAVKKLCNRFGCDRDSVKFESGLNSGGARTTVDVLIEEPDPIAVEVFYKSRFGALYRKLTAILSSGYDCYVICVDDWEKERAYPPERFDRELRNYGPIEVGRYVPEYDLLSFGTRITPQLVDLISPHKMKGTHNTLFG